MKGKKENKKAGRNRTLEILPGEKKLLQKDITRPSDLVSTDIYGKIIHGEIEKISEMLPHGIADMLFLDPPYNLTKIFHGKIFHKKHQRITKIGSPKFF